MLYLSRRLSAAETTQTDSLSSMKMPTGSITPGHSSMNSPWEVKTWDAVVVTVTHVDPPRAVHRNTVHEIERAGSAAGARVAIDHTELAHPLA